MPQSMNVKMGHYGSLLSIIGKEEQPRNWICNFGSSCQIAPRASAELTAQLYVATRFLDRAGPIKRPNSGIQPLPEQFRLKKIIGTLIHLNTIHTEQEISVLRNQ